MHKTDPEYELSEHGRVRRSEMREALIAESRRIARRRRRRREAIGVMSAAGAVAAGVWVASIRPAPAPAPSVPGGEVARHALATAPERAEPAPLADVPPRVQIVHGEVNNVLIERVSLSVDVSRYAISDDELIDLLASIGRPSGIARIGGRAMLTAPVTDEEIEAERRVKEAAS